MTTESELLRGRIAELLVSARERTHGLTGCLEDDDLIRQHSPLMSPLVWDLAHVANQEELWLLREVGGRERMHPKNDPPYDALEHPRDERPVLPLLPPAEARAYAREVRGRVLDLVERTRFTGERLVTDGFAFGMIAQHEQQHDETMLATHQLRRGAAVLAAPPVTNAAYAEFIADGGYDQPSWWTAAGWDHRQRAGLAAPQFWRRDGGQWIRTRFGASEPVPPAEPVMHVCWYEADAYARWAGRRLPTEAEWEKAARCDPATGRSRRYPWGDEDPSPDRANLGQRHLQPAQAGSYPAGAAPSGARQLIGDVWEWTSSGFLPYPGFEAWPYKEYSEVFFGGDYKVLRGGAFSVDPVVCRSTFRNWDYPVRRQIFAGLRTARDAGPGEAA